MTSGVTLWAGSLDESDDDFIYVRGRVLQPGRDDQERQQAVTEISRASDASKDLLQVGSVLVRTAGRELLLKIPVVERDIIGREAPTTGLMPKAAVSESGWVDVAVNEVAAVLEDSGRTIDSSQLRAALLQAGARRRRSQLRQLWADLRRLFQWARRLLMRFRSNASGRA